MTCHNRTELCVAALQRSGHHAIINWISANAPGSVCFLNNCRPNTDPFLMCTRDQKSELAFKDHLIYNYEDRRLTEVFKQDFLQHKKKWFGESGSCVYVLVLRDPFNNFASKYRWAINGTKWTPPMEWVTRELPGLWKSYAKEFLGQTKVLPGPSVFINYNRWFVDNEYRCEIALRLGLVTAGKGLAEVARWGPNTWGDSFDNLDFDGRANEMKVFERWRYFAGDKVFADLFRDPELLSLSEDIFGPIPGTHVLYQ
ncbi:MAG: hypothetical protein ABI596_14380 [Pyrinomonadaceae bacterium]